MRSLLTRLLNSLRPRRLGRDFEDEIATHLELATADKQASGLSRDAAARAARRDFGGVAQASLAYRDAGSLPLIETALTLGRDAVRLLWKQPRFSTIAAATLAVGIGTATAVFSVVYDVLLKPLPFRDPERLVALYQVTPASRKDNQGPATYFTYREDGRAFEDIGLWNSTTVSALREGTPEQLRALRVTDGTLSLLGVRADMGRLIGKDDDVPGAPLVVVLTHGYWRRAFGGSERVVGQSIDVNGESGTVVGVLPSSFTFLNTDPELILPYRLDRSTARTIQLGSNGLARLKAGVTIEEANADIARMIPTLPTRFPLMPGMTQAMWESVGLAPNVRPLAEVVIGDLQRPLWILLATAGVVLLVAWTNAANLLLVRAEERQRELAVRWALGASRGRLAAALLSESLVLGLVGGGLGILLAQAGLGLLGRLAPTALPRANDIEINVVVLLVTFAASVATSLAFGLIPVMRSLRLTGEHLKDGTRSSTDSSARHRARNALVIGQVGLTLVLLIVGGLMVQTFLRLQRVDPGFVRPTEVQVFNLTLPATLIREQSQVAQTYERITERLRAVPGVASVGLGVINMDGSAGRAPVFVRGAAAPGLPPIRSYWPTGPGYVETMGSRVVAGRTVTWADIHDRKPVVLISENLAREYWEAPERALGQQIGTFPEGPWREIVGVIGNVRGNGLHQPAPALVYEPTTDAGAVNRNLMFLVRSSRVGTAGFVRELERAVWAVNPNLPLGNVRTLETIHGQSMAQTSFAMAMLVVAAGIALVLGLVGVYSVIQYLASQRTSEIGVRMALGAQPSDVRRLFLGHGFALAGAGIGLGLAATWMVSPMLSALLYEVDAKDPVTYIGMSIALTGVSLLATYVPARRASQVQPMVALGLNR